tara:strand:- start:3235 stop:4044 length:810 start_codon:yes stop_codon:yes gene_type:complete
MYKLIILITVLLLIFALRIRQIHRKINVASSTDIIKKDAVKNGFPIKILNEGRGLCLAFVCIGDAYTNDVKRYTQSKLKYCKKHDYSFICLYDHCSRVKEYISKPHPSLSKLPFIEWLLDHYNKVCMIDADIYISNDNIGLESLYSDASDVVIQKTIYGNNKPVLQSSAAIFNKNARVILRKAWLNSLQPGPRLKFPGLNFEDWGEQTYLQREIEKAEKSKSLKIEYVDLSCLRHTDNCNSRYPIWHMAGSNISGKLDSHILKYEKNES